MQNLSNIWGQTTNWWSWEGMRWKEDRQLGVHQLHSITAYRGSITLYSSLLRESLKHWHISSHDAKLGMNRCAKPEKSPKSPRNDFPWSKCTLNHRLCKYIPFTNDEFLDIISLRFSKCVPTRFFSQHLFCFFGQDLVFVDLLRREICA